jgi:hypothetical protein
MPRLETWQDGTLDFALQQALDVAQLDALIAADQ